MQSIMNSWPISNEEYSELDKEFGKLCHFEAWQLEKKNTKNSKTEEQEDFVQELRIALMRAGSYYKRQTYIEQSLKIAGEYAEGKLVTSVLEELEYLWANKTRHGANRQKFGEFQENVLERIVKKFVPKSLRPNKYESLSIDPKFKTYCKNITWNAQKSMGKKITREKSWRSGLVSLSEYDYLGA